MAELREAQKSNTIVFVFKVHLSGYPSSRNLSAVFFFINYRPQYAADLNPSNSNLSRGEDGTV